MAKHLSLKQFIPLLMAVVVIFTIVAPPISIVQATAVDNSTTAIQQEDVDCVAVAFSSSNVNQLRGPDSRFGTYRVLYSGHHVTVSGKFNSPVDNALWWLIGDGSWIPSEAVATDGNCEAVRLYSFSELFGLGINYNSGEIDECIGSTDDDYDQHQSPSDSSPSTNIPVANTAANFVINAQLVITETELSWWLIDTGLWVPTSLVSIQGECDTVPLIRPDDLGILAVDPETGGVGVCTVMAEGLVPMYDEPMSDSMEPIAFNNALLTNTFWAEAAIAKYTEPTGEIWWQLANGKWVKNSDVIIHGPCGDLPETNPDPTPRLACLIHSEQPGVRVRVGPGLNRGIFTGLPENVDFAVWGQHLAPSGLLWWQIDDTTLDPDDLAATLWVSSEAVVSEGDCDDIEETDAPQVVFDPGSGGDGQWGACGSCNSCGYPENECVTSPEGQCLWDPTTCRGGGAPGGSDGCYGLGTQVVPNGIGTINILTPSNCIYPVRNGTGNGYLPGTVVTAEFINSAGVPPNSMQWSGCGASGTNATTTFTMNSTCVLVMTTS